MALSILAVILTDGKPNPEHNGLLHHNISTNELYRIAMKIQK